VRANYHGRKGEIEMLFLACNACGYESTGLMGSRADKPAAPDFQAGIRRARRVMSVVGLTALILMGLLLLSGLLTGCTPTVTHQVEAPQLDRLAEAAKKITVQNCERPGFTLAPIGQDVVIDIRGDKVTANTDGVRLLKDYVKAREWINQWSPR